jgi:hypothetical protein
VEDLHLVREVTPGSGDGESLWDILSVAQGVMQQAVTYQKETAVGSGRNRPFFRPLQLPC